MARVHVPGRDALHLPGHYEVQVACPGEERTKTLTLHGLLKGDYRAGGDPAERDRLLAAFDAAEAGTFTRRRDLLVGNLYSGACKLAARDELGRAVIYTTEDGRRERGVLLEAELTFEILSEKPLALRTPDQLRRFVDDHGHEDRAVAVSADTGGRPERWKRGVDFALVLRRGELSLVVPGAHARNGPLLHDPRWRALDIPLEGNRTALQGVIPPSAVPGALQVLGDLGPWLVGADYRDWYNRLAAEAPAAGAVSARPIRRPIHRQRHRQRLRPRRHPNRRRATNPPRRPRSPSAAWSPLEHKKCRWKPIFWEPA
ncbi:MAG: hypothetical protein V9G22_11435 [Ottowia sp.]